jgi:hypothetical protein
MLLWKFEGHTFVLCVWSDSMTIAKNVMDKLCSSQMDMLTVCDNYLYYCGEVMFIYVDELSLL